MDPRRAGVGDDHAGGAEDRQAADDAEPAVHRFHGERLATWDGYGDEDVAAVAAEARGRFGDRLSDHRPWPGIDRGLARRYRQSGAGDCAHALASLEENAAAGSGPC